MRTDLRSLVFFPAIILNLLTGFIAEGQTVQTALRQADSLLSRGDYEAAVKLYDRVLFFDEEGYASKSYENIARCYFLNKQYAKAASYFSIAGSNTNHDSIASAIFQKKTICLILDEQFLAAREELFAMPDTYASSQEGILLMALSYYGNQETEAAFKEFAKLEGLKQHSTELKKLKRKLERAERKNPKTAKVLSIIVPGTGQIYAGDWRNGINSFLLTGGLMALGIHSMITVGVLDGLLLVGPWYQRYYTGGFNRAALSVEAMKKKTRYEVLQSILSMSNHAAQP
jgi:tetratricopeptide (TPR) repeat protein